MPLIAINDCLKAYRAFTIYTHQYRSSGKVAGPSNVIRFVTEVSRKPRCIVALITVTSRHYPQKVARNPHVTEGIRLLSVEDLHRAEMGMFCKLCLNLVKNINSPLELPNFGFWA